MEMDEVGAHQEMDLEEQFQIALIIQIMQYLHRLHVIETGTEMDNLDNLLDYEVVMMEQICTCIIQPILAQLELQELAIQMNEDQLHEITAI